ncbi:GBF-interacting protein 1-like [Olea europaea var. sylvestris]|uniref:GBF-interacting protein 1-like n=1 Tax=Olea europaea var. sylvestris TaxID=158386 RepID=UPI000C1D3B13|nr:GBF-interacting protein 1-like [Olea europaea var. sylvestris]
MVTVTGSGMSGSGGMICDWWRWCTESAGGSMGCAGGSSCKVKLLGSCRGCVCGYGVLFILTKSWRRKKSIASRYRTNFKIFWLQGGVPLVLSTAAPTPLVTQATGVMQSSQQPLPVFRQPTGMHLPHYPPNYVPYSPYFSPYYVPPAAVHQFLATGALPQQPQAGSMYPTPPGATAKYSVSQFKQGPNAGNPTYMGVPGSYGPYGLSMANYTSSSATTVVTSTSNEDLAAHQVKENSLYVSGQQSEGSGVWFTTPSQDISSLQASSFYNLPQSQLPFTPTQPGHGTFAGMYHPSQAAATVHHLLQQSQTITSPVDMVGPPTSVYQQPQHTQLNWSSNY